MSRTPGLPALPYVRDGGGHESGYIILPNRNKRAGSQTIMLITKATAQLVEQLWRLYDSNIGADVFHDYLSLHGYAVPCQT